MSTLFALALLLPIQDGAAHRFHWGNPRPQGAAIRALAFSDAEHGYGVGDFGTTVATEDGGRSWVARGDFALFSADLNDLVVLDGGDLLAVGASPGIFRSSDGGESWNTVSHPGDAQLESLEITGAGRLVAAGEAGTVLVSTDGGVTWDAQPYPEGATLLEQFWLSPVRGFVIGDGTPHETNDGGASWTPLPGVTPPLVDHYNEIVFGTPLDGWIVDDFGQWSTHDGGTSWRWESLFTEPLYLGETIAFDAEHRILVTNGEGAFVYETFDDGEQWELLHYQESAVGFLDLVQLVDGTLVASTEIGDLVWSSDAGASWTNATRSPTDGPRVNIGAVAVLANGRAFAAGRDSSSFHRFLRSDDAGRSWREIPHFLDYAVAMGFRDLALGLAGGDVDVIARTSNGGESWQPVSLGGWLGGVLRVSDLAFAGAAIYASAHGQGPKGAVLRSIDDGQSWQLANSGLPTSRPYTSVSFPAPDLGFVCGGGAGQKWLYRTQDAGASWQSMSTTGLPDLLHVTRWFDASTGLVASRSAGIWRTVDGGASWTQVHADPCDHLHFRDSLHGVAGTTIGEVLITEDGGASWELVPAPLPDTFVLGPVPFAVPGGFVVGSTNSSIVVATTAPIVSYCACDEAASACDNADGQAGCANSSGNGALLSATGSTSVSSDDLMLFATPLPTNQSALLFMGAGQIELPFGDGQRCVSGGGLGLFRYPVRNAGPDGLLREGPGLVALSHSRFAANGHIHAGQTWHFQAWYRDSMGPCGSAFNLSNALSVTFDL